MLPPNQLSEQQFHFSEHLSEGFVVPTIVRGAKLLKELSRGTHRLSDLARQLKFSKSCTHRLLESLRQAGLVVKDQVTSQYYIGPLIFELSSNPHTVHANLIESVFEDLRYLNNKTHETVAIFIRLGTQRICLEELPSIETIKYMAGRGYTAPIHLGSPGKMLLAQLTDGELRELLDKIQLETKASNTANTKVGLKREIASIRKNGYAISFGQRVPGSASISVAIKNYMVPVVLTILGPKDRIRSKVNFFLKDMLHVADRISARLKDRKFDK